jgi:hypothetical protein
VTAAAKEIIRLIHADITASFRVELLRSQKLTQTELRFLGSGRFRPKNEKKKAKLIIGSLGCFFGGIAISLTNLKQEVLQ